MTTDLLEQVRKDITFLLEFTPASDPAEVVPGLAPMFYITESYDGDMELAKKVHEIRDRYDITIADPEEEDFEEIG